LQRLKWYGIFWRKHDHDRYMLRVRIPGCEMTAAQPRALAFAAYEAGHEIIDITTRGNIQIQGLTIEKIPRVSRPSSARASPRGRPDWIISAMSPAIRWPAWIPPN
jgi:sulfite reductase beta subunit-like hemoprotein